MLHLSATPSPQVPPLIDLQSGDHASDPVKQVAFWLLCPSTWFRFQLSVALPFSLDSHLKLAQASLQESLDPVQDRFQRFEQLEDLLDSGLVSRGDPMLSSPNILHVSPASSPSSSVDAIELSL